MEMTAVPTAKSSMDLVEPLPASLCIGCVDMEASSGFD